MSKNHSIEQIKEEIEAIKQELLAIGPMHPGSISQQYHACGNPSCRCHDPQEPKKHGPYNKMTYVHRGRSACRFVKAEHLEELKDRLLHYKRFKKLMDRWIKLSIDMATIEFFDKSRKGASKKPATKKRSRKN